MEEEDLEKVAEKKPAASRKRGGATSTEALKERQVVSSSSKFAFAKSAAGVCALACGRGVEQDEQQVAHQLFFKHSCSVQVSLMMRKLCAKMCFRMIFYNCLNFIFLFQGL